jgi:hypothetical protein
MKNSNNNQKYIAKAAYFIPYDICADMDQDQIRQLVFDTSDYMANFNEIKMLSGCTYLEAKNGSIIKMTDHADFLDRWQFEEELKKKNIKFIVIHEGSDKNEMMDRLKDIIGNVFEAGIDIFDAKAHEYVNPCKEPDEDIEEYFEERTEAYFKRAVKTVDITEKELYSLKLNLSLWTCMFVPHALLGEDKKETITRNHEAAALFGIEHPNLEYDSLLCENSQGLVVLVDPLTLRTVPTVYDYPDRYLDVVCGEYDVVLIPSIEDIETSELLKNNIYSMLANGTVIFGLKEMKGICSDRSYESKFVNL